MNGQSSWRQALLLATLFLALLHPVLPLRAQPFGQLKPPNGKRFGEDKARLSDMPEGGFAYLRPWFIKILRMYLADDAFNPQLMVSELDSYIEQVETMQAALRAKGLPEAKQEWVLGPGMRAELVMRKLSLYAELGQLEAFEREAPALIQKAEQQLELAVVNITGHRAALRRHEWGKASQYLTKAKASLRAAGPNASPTLDYALRSGEYFLRYGQAESAPSQAELLADFKSAWGALKAYQALTVIDHEWGWGYGRLATRQWLELLAAHPEALAEQSRLMETALTDWLSRFDNFEKLVRDKRDLLVQPNEAHGYWSLGFGLLDQALLLAEAQAENGLKSNLDSGRLQATLQRLVDDQTFFELQRTGPGFPPFDISRGGLVSELKGRGLYLQALLSNEPEAQRVATLGLALEQIKQAGHPQTTIIYQLKIGRKLADWGAPDQAVKLWQEALSSADALGFVRYSGEASRRLAEEFARRGDWKSAEPYVAKAAKSMQEKATTMSAKSSDGKTMMKSSAELAEMSAKSAAKSGQPEAALAALNQTRQVQSAALQMEAHKEARAEAREVAAKEDGVAMMAGQVEQLQAMPVSPTRDALLKNAQSLLADNRTQFLTQSRSLRQKFSDLYVRALRFDPLDLAGIQKSLPADVAVVCYFPTDEGLYIFLVTRDTFRLRQVAVKEAELNAKAQSLMRGIRRAQADDKALTADTASLSSSLIHPIWADLEGRTTLVLVPAGRLNMLPFGCLTDPSGATLLSTRRLLELAKATDLAQIPATAQANEISSVVTFANATGDLPAASTEGKQIAGLFPGSKLFDGKEASKANFLRFGTQAKALHLATHGEWNVEDSLANYLAMAGTEKIGQEEIFSLTFDDTSLVILSACNTAMGEGGDVRYVASLAEAFWIAGSRSVVASLWAVNDESTALLMGEFYRALRAGQPKAEALRAAQLAVASKEQFRHPYYWSGFVLFGDWR